MATAGNQQQHCSIARLLPRVALLLVPAILAAGCGMSGQSGQLRPSATAVERSPLPSASPSAPAPAAQTAAPQDDPNKPVPSPYKWNGSAERVVEGTPNADPNAQAGVAGAAAGQPQFRGKTVMVEPGDTLTSIAKRHGVAVATLKQINGLKGNNLQSGQMLVIPTTAR